MKACRAALLIAAALAGTCAAASDKLSPDLRRTADATIDVIVQYRDTADTNRVEKLRGKGGQPKADLPLIKGTAASIPASRLAELADDPDVAYVSPDRKVATQLDYGVPAVTADIVRSYGWTGAGIGIAVIDSGILTRPDLQYEQSAGSRVVYEESFGVNGGTTDQFGHGTHVAGIIAGNGRASSGNPFKVTFVGVAPQANLLNLRALDSNGAGTDSGVIAAIQRAVELKDRYNVRVINLSLGRPVFDSVANDPLCRAVEQAWNAGMVVVVAAGNGGRDNETGNQGYGTILSPGNDPYAISVGATKTSGTSEKTDDFVTSYSSKGPTALDLYVKPDIVAPGNRIVSLAGIGNLFRQFPESVVPLSYYSTNPGGNSGQYFRLSGTSMAAGFVSGAAALMLQQDPSLTPDQVKARMMKTAWKGFNGAVSTVLDPENPGVSYTTEHDIFTVGAGYLDVSAALADTEVTTGPAHSPRVAFDVETCTFYLAFDDGDVSPLRRNVVWGSNVLRMADAGEVLSLRRNVVWGSGLDFVWASRRNVVWGSGLDDVLGSRKNVVCGSSVSVGGER